MLCATQMMTALMGSIAQTIMSALVELHHRQHRQSHSLDSLRCVICSAAQRPSVEAVAVDIL